MEKITTEIPDLPVSSQFDLPETMLNSLVIPLLNKDIFDTMHEECHTYNYFFEIGHKAVQLAAHAILSDNSREDALLTGCAIYETVVSVCTTTDYRGTVQQSAAYESASKAVSGETLREFVDLAEYAGEKMRGEAPVLHSAVVEIADRRLRSSEGSLAYAVAGAGLMRQMQIHLDRRLAS
jgi:hypothetical protein